MSKPAPDTDPRLLSALIDGEADEGELRGLLGPVDASSPRSANASGSLLKRHAILRGLSDATRENATRYNAPMRLQALPAQVGRERNARPSVFAAWFNPRLAGAVLATAIVCVGATTLVLRGRDDAALEGELVSLHLRSMMAPSPIEVASADSHTVKPWFNGRIKYSPPVEDFGAQGFPLIGGRLEVLAGEPVSALVYRHKQHLINLYVLPAAAGARYAGLKETQRDGFNIMARAQGGFVYLAVSDLNGAELGELLRLAAAPRPG